MTELRFGQRHAGTPSSRAPRDPAIRAGFRRWRRAIFGACLPALIGVTSGACGAPAVMRPADAILPAADSWPVLVVDETLQGATLLAATARLSRGADGVCVVTITAQDGTARVETPCDDGFSGQPIDFAPVALRVGRSTGSRTPDLIEIFRADEGFLRDSFGARLLVAARGTDLPLRLGTDVRVELGAGPDQRVASEVVSRADGCAFAFAHGRLGLSDRERLTWAAARETLALEVEGVALVWQVHAVALPARGDGGCEAEPAIGFTILRPLGGWPKAHPTPGHPTPGAARDGDEARAGDAALRQAPRPRP